MIRRFDQQGRDVTNLTGLWSETDIRINVQGQSWTTVIEHLENTLSKTRIIDCEGDRT